MTDWIEEDKIDGEFSQCLHLAATKTLATLIIIKADTDQVTGTEKQEENECDEYRETVEDPAGDIAVLWAIERTCGVALKLQ
uniref:Uncharacterized protein n=1 Tax=Amphimedon queenslandica TaxID=400682 RepID=A0A1X7UII9_AMPQE